MAAKLKYAFLCAVAALFWQVGRKASLMTKSQYGNLSFYKPSRSKKIFKMQFTCAL